MTSTQWVTELRDDLFTEICTARRKAPTGAWLEGSQPTSPGIQGSHIRPPPPRCAPAAPLPSIWQHIHTASTNAQRHFPPVRLKNKYAIAAWINFSLGKLELWLRIRVITVWVGLEKTCSATNQWNGSFQWEKLDSI